jgi:two-component system, NarL family, sensor histidine kinase DesK
MSCAVARARAAFDSVAARATGLAVAGLGLMLFARLSDILTPGEPGHGEPAAIAFTLALFFLPVAYAFPQVRPALERWRWWVLGVQGALSWIPFAIFGQNWELGIGGLLAGLVLLMVPGRGSWLLAGGLLSAEVAVRGLVTGLPAAPAWIGIVVTASYYADDALVLFGLVRLAQIVNEVGQSRARAAELAAADVRLRAAEALRAAIGERLEGISARASAARALLGRDAAGASAQLAAVGVAARDAVDEARGVTARRLAMPGQPSRPGPEPVIGARLAWALLVAVLLSYMVENLAWTVWNRFGPGLTALALADIVLTALVQFCHSRALRLGRRPRAWPLTLALQVLLVYAFVFPFVRVYVGALGGFLAGSVLLLVPGRWRWPGAAAVIFSWAVLIAVLPLRGFDAGPSAMTAVLYAGAGSLTTVLVYGLSRMAGLARELETLRDELAGSSAVRERLRIARDVHDLLGLGLSAMALKADLVRRLIGCDDERAAAEIEAISRTCATVRADLRLATSGERGLSLGAELIAAQEILASAGIDVTVNADSSVQPALADEVLAPVVREAVTNVLRHATATTCRVDAAVHDGFLRLRVVNDLPAAEAGERGNAAPASSGGRGLANLTARLETAGGQLRWCRGDGMFELTAAVPLTLYEPGPAEAHGTPAGRARDDVLAAQPGP